MVVSDTRPLKRAKRSNRVTADLCDFLTFATVGDAAFSDQPFRESVQGFLSRHARVTFPPSVFPRLMTWQILFRVGGLVVDGPDPSPVVVALDVVEEDVTISRPCRSVYCDQCRVVGWSGHPVCGKRYHFIIRADSSPVDGYQKSCTRCGTMIHLSELRCKYCHSAIMADDLEDWVYSQFEDHTHLLHGVVHSNGYGHLLTLNGREGGSRVLSGCDIMNFWDRLCTMLSVRKVSVMDVSKKYDMEYRLLHAITKGHSWYGNWGYEFGSGSYGLTLDAYKRAVDTLSSLPLAPLLIQGRKSRTPVQDIIAFYQSLSESELLTYKDLFLFLLRLIDEKRKSLMPKETRKMSESSSSNVLCAWTRNDVEHAQQAMIKVLVAAAGETKWVTRRSLKGVMCKTASPEFLDYCLKHFGGKLGANGMVVQARHNPNSNDVEFRLQPASSTHYVYSSYPSEEQIKRDLRFLYNSLLHPKTMVSHRPQVMRDQVADSTTKLLDCKQFMKEYNNDKLTVNNMSAINLWCQVELSDRPKEDPAPPPELIILPLTATVGDLKSEASKAFREVYAMFERFDAEELLEYGFIEDSLTLKLLVGTSGSVRIKGRCLAKHRLNRFRMERGTENWTVDCPCGAKDDDGERMLACDSCSVWQHTRCAGIDSSDDIPAKFVCMRCIRFYYKKTEMDDNEAYKISQSSKSSTCRGEVVRTVSSGVGTTLTML